MKYSVGYQFAEEDDNSFVSAVEKYKDKIEEVYFPWVNIPSGRASISEGGGYVNWRALDELVGDIKKIKSMGIKTDLLFNANCYGEDSMSENMLRRIASVLDYLEDEDIFPEAVTCASPAVAYMVRTLSEKIDIRASVNMRIGSIKGLEYVKHLFDSFVICRDVNRDLSRLADIKAWCIENGKEMYLLANSGCMRDCSFQIFHDNMVAHNEDILKSKNISGFLPYACWNYIKDPSRRPSVLQNTWIRPEDVHNYEPFVNMMKLATRMHELPEMVIGAYATESYDGNLLDLFEPGFGPAFAPSILRNKLFPDDWFEKTTACDKRCESCEYCKNVYERIVCEG